MRVILKKTILLYAVELEKLSSNPKPKMMISEPKWMKEEISLLKQYFGQFTRKIEEENVGLFGFIASFFKSESSNTNTNQVEKKVEKNRQQRTMKVLVDGVLGAGKTTFINSFANNLTVGSGEQRKIVDFECVSLCLPSIDVKIQLFMWDVCGAFSFRKSDSSSLYYLNCSIVLLLVDPYSEFHVEKLDESIANIREYTKDAEIILISTKKDLENDQKRLISPEEMERIAFTKFGGLYLDISQTDSIDSRRIVWYCILYRYLSDFIK